ncbi:phosphatidylglycerophosphatase A [Aquisalimonas lutea]|uniref:phosphatidylglycerophosphatase A family protein n=1 Tax=Aquisalimonas lutea TaxID=1327750 RepID=UPI0025B57B42|nr:phosphatidylglycerophosphatase A [Aquisalimonas lutea]MDN3518923.1 phosphatidylglycerophosphatase A [Aquisalimonas lutea]
MAESGIHRSLRGRVRWRDPVHILALGGGAGLSPWAPGTAGTLAAIPLYGLLLLAPGWLYGVLVVAAAVAGLWICDRAARDFGVHDHPAIVWDEVTGFLVTMAAAPAGWPWVVAGFALFRLFDVVKPWPIGWLDRRVTGGLGIMADDVLAGVYAAACLAVLARLGGAA